MRQYQQGDVLFAEVDGVPAGARAVAARGTSYVLVEGETTGHAHTVEAAPEVELFEADGVLYLRTKTGATVEHQEHHPITLAPGAYEVGRVQEYDYDAEERRAVMD